MIISSHFRKGEQSEDHTMFNDLPIEPEMTFVYGVRWEEGTYKEEDGKKTWLTPSKLIFPNAFNGEIATDVSLVSSLIPF